MKEIELIQKLKVWIASYFSESDLEIDEEVKLFLGDEPQKIKTDLVVIQSKSNVLHSFEVKNSLNQSSFNSALWQVESLYGNYKWLVIGQPFKYNKEFKKLIRDKGIGVVYFRTEIQDFNIEIQPKYIDGNFLHFYPTLKEKWNNKLGHGSNTRSKKKN